LAGFSEVFEEGSDAVGLRDIVACSARSAKAPISLVEQEAMREKEGAHTSSKALDISNHRNGTSENSALVVSFLTNSPNFSTLNHSGGTIFPFLLLLQLIATHNGTSTVRAGTKGPTVRPSKVRNWDMEKFGRKRRRVWMEERKTCSDGSKLRRW